MPKIFKQNDQTAGSNPNNPVRDHSMVRPEREAPTQTQASFFTQDDRVRKNFEDFHFKRDAPRIVR